MRYVYLKISEKDFKNIRKIMMKGAYRLVKQADGTHLPTYINPLENYIIDKREINDED
jgi:hypothetical protein